METIKILSPVHISTGNTIEEPSYLVDNNMVYRYDFSQLLSAVSREVYLDKILLDDLRNERKDKKRFYKRLVNYFDYSKQIPMYSLSYQLNYNLKDYPYGVSEQIKTLNIPYIPGSSIKGALLNSWLYYVLKHNYSIIEHKLEGYLSSNTKKSLIGLLLGNLESEFMKDLSSLLMCNDIHFKNYELLEAKRIGAGKDMDKMIPLRYEECLQENQSVETILFSIDDYKYKYLLSKDKYSKNKNAMLLLKNFNKLVILKAMNEYTYDLLDEEISGNNRILYKNYPDILIQVKTLKKILEEKNDNKFNVVLRIGNSTNYFFKSITLLIKNNSPELYYKYFDSVFSPSTYWKTKAKAKSLPKTKVVLSNKNKNYLAGFVLITYDKKS